MKPIMELSIPITSSKMARCPTCPLEIIQNQNMVSQINNDTLPDFIHQLNCCHCTTKWYYCVTCTGMRKHMTHGTQLRRHLNIYHKSCIKSPQANNNHITSMLQFPSHKADQIEKMNTQFLLMNNINITDGIDKV